ncbi:MAG: hypothetical protein RL660_2928 [Bacteroidota bacterium]|jgi:hypothetical protein
MKFRSILMTSLVFAALAGTVFTSCQRERDNDTSEGDDVVLFERENDDILGMSEQAYLGQLGQYKTRANCAIVTKDSISIPNVITIDFGTTNCLCKDGKNRRGKVILTYTGAYKDSGTVRTVSYDQYFVNDNQIRGGKTITNNGKNVNGNTTYSIVSNDSIDKANNAGTATFSSTRTREYIAGEGTAQWGDDKYSVTGNATGTRATGYSWSMAITQPLIIDHSCVYRITQGEIEIQPQGKALRKLNYGTGTCDNDATLTINTKTFNIKFK